MSQLDSFAIFRRDSWNDMTSLREAMNRLLETSYARPNVAFASGTSLDVPFDLTETETEYRIQARVPGMKPDDLHVSVHNNTVTIEGERREGGPERRTYSEQRFARSFSLPISIDADHTQADFQDGVLTLRLPKLEAARPRRIEIGAASGEGGAGPAVPGRSARGRL